MTQAQLKAQDIEAQNAELQQQVDRLLEQFDNHQIARYLQRSHNALSDDQRQGYRMEIRLFSRDYQLGGYDTSY